MPEPIPATMKISETASKNLCFENTMEELPDCVKSYIFSKLSMVDLVKTSILSKRWIHEWGSIKHLNFDLDNMYSRILCREPEDSQLYEFVRSEFVERVDQFMSKYQGANIHSIKVNYPMVDNYSHVFDRLIFQGFSKGVQKIELLFSHKLIDNYHRRLEPYTFSLSSEIHQNDSLKHLHLQNCFLLPPMHFSRLNKLTTLVLHLVVIHNYMLLGLFSSCVNLVDLTIQNCEFDSDLNITSPTLSHLKIVDHRRSLHRFPPPTYWEVDIFALNLSTFEYSSRHGAFKFNRITAPKLSKFNCNDLIMPSDVFCGMGNLTKIVLVQVVLPEDILPSLFSNCHLLEELTFWGCNFESPINIISPTLRRLNIIDFGIIAWTLDIDALNLSSFDYSGQLRIRSIKAPKLLNLFWNTTNNDEIPRAFDIIASLHQLQNLSINLSHSQIAMLPRILGPFQSLTNLDLFISGHLLDPNCDFFRILDIVMASPRLQELHITISDPLLFSDQRLRKEPERFSHNAMKYVEFRGCAAGNTGQNLLARHRRKNRSSRSSLKKIAFSDQWLRKEPERFSHNELKYVEFRGCAAGNTDQNLLARHLWKNMSSSSSLKKIAFKPPGKFYVGAGIWKMGSDDDNYVTSGIKFMCEMLKDEVLNNVYLSFCSIVD